jgi:hypothetical protein
MFNDRSPASTAAGRLASLISRTCTRRGFLSRLGRVAAGAAGVGFAHAVIAPYAFATPGCTHETTEPDACNKASGIKCGFHNSTDCAKFKNNASCTACKVDADGCPDGTKKGSQWQACCACKEDGTKGEYIKYWDCCGTALSADCAACTNVSSCSGMTSCPGSWCGGTPGSPLCTFLENTNTACTP